MSGPSYHGQTHEFGGTDEVEATITVTDGSTTVDAASELDIGFGLVLTSPGGGVAAIAAPALAYARAQIVTGSYTNPSGDINNSADARVPLAVTGSSGVDVSAAASGVLTIQEPGFYLIGFSAGIDEPTVGAPSEMRALAGDSSVDDKIFEPMNTGVGVAVVGATGLMFCDVGDTAEWRIGSGAAGAITVHSNLAPEMWLIRVNVGP